MVERASEKIANDFQLLYEGLQQIDAGLSIYDAELRLVAANPSFREIFDLPAEMVEVGASFEPVLRLLVGRGLYGEVDVDAFVAGALAGLRRMEGSFNYERRVPDGRIFESRTTRLASGGYLTIHTDITKHKEIEASLRESQEQLLETSCELALILENASIGIMTVVPGENGRRVLHRVNRALERILGYACGELEDIDTSQLYPNAEEYLRVTAAYQDIVCTGQTYHSEYLFRRKDGSTLVGDLRGSAIDPEEPARGAVWLLEDVTERRRIEHELLRKSVLLQAGTDHMAGALVVWDRDLNYVYWTPRAERYFLLPPGTLYVGKPFREMARYFAERGDFGPGDIEAQIEGQMRPFLSRESMVIERRMPDGSVLEVRREPLPDGGYVSVFQDITERKRMENDLRQAKEAAEAAATTIRQKSEQVAALLDNSGQGFLSFAADLRVNGEYSRACVAMLGRVPADEDLSLLLFPDQPGAAELMRDLVPRALALSDEGDRASLLRQLPTELHIGEKFLKVDFRSLENGQLMAVLTDVSDEYRLRALSLTDRLTCMANRRQLDELLAAALDQARRTGLPLTLMIIDIDHFKAVNDAHGHLVGDQVLIEVAGILRAHMRRVDHVGRWGGEEFMVLCLETDEHGAGVLAEKLRREIETHEFAIVGHKTCSFGVATHAHGETLEALIERADRALYRAKEGGRNRVAVADD